MADNIQHEDFGEKIGGAKKDLWKDRGLYVNDLDAMNEREAEKFVKKDNIWKKPDYQAMLDDGIPLGVVYFIKKARDGLNASPQYYRRDDTPEKRLARQKEYIQTVRELQGAVSEVRTVEDAMQVYDRFFVENGYLEQVQGWGSGTHYQVTEKGREKSVTGRVIPKSERERLEIFEHMLSGMQAQEAPQIGRVETDFYRNSVRMGKECEKDGGYWDSNVEMTARAFACYIKDKLPYQSDYLVGHADCAVTFVSDKDGKMEVLKAYPEGEERRAINAVFDEIVADLKREQMNEEYKDISFGLYASADLTALDGSVIPAGGLLEVVSVDPNEAGGYDASFASDLPFGSYYVKERTTNNAYILSDTEYPVVFEYAGQEAALVQILVNEGEVVSNDLLRGRVDGVKVGENPEGGEDVKLSGALMGLFRPDTEEFTEENALLTVTTAEDGSFAFENIPYGHWIVKEISSPALYTVSPQQHHIYIGVDGQRIEIKVENTLIRGSVQVMKTEAVDEPSSVKKEDKDNNTFLRFLYGAVFDLYEDANGNKEFDSEDMKIGTLKESEAGYHTAEGLLAKGYCGGFPLRVVGTWQRVSDGTRP